MGLERFDIYGPSAGSTRITVEKCPTVAGRIIFTVKTDFATAKGVLNQVGLTTLIFALNQMVIKEP